MTWIPLSGGALALAEILYAVTEAADVLTAANDDDALTDTGDDDDTDEQPPAWVGMQALYDYVITGDPRAGRQVRAALPGNPRLRADLTRLLERSAAWMLPRMAAASSGAIERRQGRDCALVLRPSRAESAQVYVTIALERPDGDLPTALMAVPRDGTVERRDLRFDRDGTAQFIVDRDGPLHQALLDPFTDIYLA